MSDGQMFEREIFWISEYNSTNNAIGYNMTGGGDCGPIRKGPEHHSYGKLPNKKLIEYGKSLKGRTLIEIHGEEKANYIIERMRIGSKGKTITEENRKSMRERRHTEATKKKMSISQKEYAKNNMENKLAGVKKMADAKRGKPSHNRVSVICTTNYKVYNSILEASKKLNLHRPNISRVLSGLLKSTGGYMFQKLTAEHLIF